MTKGGTEVAPKRSLLVVDDEPGITQMLAEYFGDKGYQVMVANDAAQARALLALCRPQLALLDIHMPGENGLALATWLRQAHPAVGIVMLTTAAGVLDRVAGLELAADDYIAKPFDLREVLARVQSVLRRIEPPAAPGDLRLGMAVLKLALRKLHDADGRDLAITAMEFDLLKVLVDHPNVVLSRDQLMERAHHREWDALDRSIDLRIMRLRRKIEHDPDKPEVIKTVRGAGYMLCLP